MFKVRRAVNCLYGSYLQTPSTVYKFSNSCFGIIMSRPASANQIAAKPRHSKEQPIRMPETDQVMSSRCKSSQSGAQQRKQLARVSTVLMESHFT